MKWKSGLMSSLGYRAARPREERKEIREAFEEEGLRPCPECASYTWINLVSMAQTAPVLGIYFLMPAEKRMTTSIQVSLAFGFKHK